jgi:hypothetical protein
VPWPLYDSHTYNGVSWPGCGRRSSAPGTVTLAQLDPVQRKAALVARLRELKAQGLTYEAIANQLNVERVPTISGRGHWTGGTVGKLLKE